MLRDGEGNGTAGEHLWLQPQSLCCCFRLEVNLLTGEADHGRELFLLYQINLNLKYSTGTLDDDKNRCVYATLETRMFAEESRGKMQVLTLFHDGPFLNQKSRNCGEQAPSCSV